MQIIKLVYISHGWMLGLHSDKLIHKPTEAWRYGPVVPSVYHDFKSYGGSDIDTAPVDKTTYFATNKQVALVQEVVSAYKDYDGLELSTITHMPGTPWHTVYKDGRGLGSIIPDRIIEKYYARLANA